MVKNELSISCTQTFSAVFHANVEKLTERNLLNGALEEEKRKEEEVKLNDRHFS
jgi:hypothetical protein